MKHSLNFLLILLVITCFLILPGCSEPSDEEEVTEEAEELVPEKDEPDVDNDLAEDPGKEDKNEPEPFPGSTFKHEVKMNVNGVIKEEKGEEWWKFD